MLWFALDSCPDPQLRPWAAWKGVLVDCTQQECLHNVSKWSPVSKCQSGLTWYVYGGAFASDPIIAAQELNLTNRDSCSRYLLLSNVPKDLLIIHLDRRHDGICLQSIGRVGMLTSHVLRRCYGARTSSLCNVSTKMGCVPRSFAIVRWALILCWWGGGETGSSSAGSSPDGLSSRASTLGVRGGSATPATARHTAVFDVWRKKEIEEGVLQRMRGK